MKTFFKILTEQLRMAIKANPKRAIADGFWTMTWLVGVGVGFYGFFNPLSYWWLMYVGATTGLVAGAFIAKSISVLAKDLPSVTDLAVTVKTTKAFWKSIVTGTVLYTGIIIFILLPVWVVFDQTGFGFAATAVVVVGILGVVISPLALVAQWTWIFRTIARAA